MGFLDLFNNKIDNVELAEELFGTLGVGGGISPKYEKEIRKIENECKNNEPYPDRQKILLKVIELAGVPETSRQRYLLAIAYAWSRANYREKAIEYIELYLNNKLYDKICFQHSSDGNYEEGKKKHVIDMYNYEFKALMGLYKFDKALVLSEKMINIDESNPIGYMAKADALIKLNRLDECRNWLKEQKKTTYYKLNKKYSETAPENWFYFTINRLLKDVEEKIDKGYKYRPRKQK